MQIEIPGKFFRTRRRQGISSYCRRHRLSQPIYAMSQQLLRQDKPFHVIYCTRSEADTAFMDELKSTLGDRLTLHHDSGDPELAL